MAAVQRQPRQASRAGWTYWIIYNEAFRVSSQNLATDAKVGDVTKKSYLNLYFQEVKRLGSVIPDDGDGSNQYLQFLQSLQDNSEDVIVGKVTVEPTKSTVGSNTVVKLTVQIVSAFAKFESSEFVHKHGNVFVVFAFDELADVVFVTLKAEDIVVFLNPAKIGVNEIFLNSDSEGSNGGNCNVFYMADLKLTDTRKPFGNKFWCAQNLVQKVFVHGARSDALFRIIPLQQQRRGVNGASVICEDNLEYSIREPELPPPQLPPPQTKGQNQTRRERTVCLNEVKLMTDNLERFYYEEVEEDQVQEGSDTTLNQSRSPSVIASSLPSGFLRDRRRKRQSSTTSFGSFNSGSTSFENEINGTFLDRSRSVCNNGSRHRSNERRHEISEEPQEDGDDNENEAVLQNFDHFENDTSRTKRPRTRLDVSAQLEGGFFRERHEESLREQQEQNGERIVPVSFDRWDRPRPKVVKNNMYNYETLKQLELKLIQGGGEHRMIKYQCYLYGVVVGTQIAPEAGAHRLSISDETKSDVILRIHVTINDNTTGPKPHDGDIIRVHRATVQFEGNRMVISTTPHHNYTLFDYKDNITGPIEIATCAKSINYTEYDQKRIVELRSFIKGMFEQERRTTQLRQEILDEENANRELILNSSTTSSIDSFYSAAENNSPRRVAQGSRSPVHSQINNHNNEGTGFGIGGGANIALHSSNSEGVSSEVRTQNGGFEGEVPVVPGMHELETALIDNLNLGLGDEQRQMFFEELAVDTRCFTLKVWVLKCYIDVAKDLFILRVADGTAPKSHHFVKHYNDDEVANIIINEGRANEEVFRAPAIDVAVINASANPDLLGEMMSAEYDVVNRYLLGPVSIRDRPGPCTRKRDARLEVDATKTTFMRFEGEDQMSGKAILNIVKIS